MGQLPQKEGQKADCTEGDIAHAGVGSDVKHGVGMGVVLGQSRVTAVCISAAVVATGCKGGAESCGRY